tara:strand:+ start:41 stop:790 length:750 start_codon:yes stop_codon:yes gene_type:complete
MSCLFISLGRLLNIDPTTLRNQICDYIITNPSKEWDGTKISDWIQYVAGDRYQNIQQYISEMRHSNTWGGAPEIAVCCMIHDITIEVVNLRESRFTSSSGESSQSTQVFKDHSRESSQTTQSNVINNPSSQKPSELSVEQIYHLWLEYKGKLHQENPGLNKLVKFNKGHPLRKNYESFMKHKKLYFLENKLYNDLLSQSVRINKSNNNPPPQTQTQSQTPSFQKILTISWTGNHYEPIGIKNHHPSQTE